MFAVRSSGSLAGLTLFAIQHFTDLPLIERAEACETAARRPNPTMIHPDESWCPTDGWEHTSPTALTAILSGIGFAALLFGSVSLTGTRVDVRRGALRGFAAFVCFSLASALGLPTQPPNTAVADIVERQLWWIGTVIPTAVGLWWLAGSRRA